MLRNFACLSAALALAACAGLSLKPGVSTENDVIAALGKPAAVYPVPGGGRVLAYPTGPAGTQTYLADLSPDGRLVRYEQVLSEDRFARIDRGTTTREELERLIGPPWRRIDFPNKRQVAWDYVFQDTWGYIVDYSVMVDGSGVVMETVSVRRDFGKGSGMAK